MSVDVMRNVVMENHRIKKIVTLAEDPFQLDVKKIMGRKEKLYWVRVGDYRILYEIYLEKKVVLIVNIDKRSRIYEG